MNQTRELAAAIDIGTGHTRAILGRFTSDNKLDVLAFSEVVTQGVRNGVVVNIDDAAESIRKAVTILERATNLKVKKLYAGISGQKIANRPYTCYRMTEGNEVTQGIVKGLSDEARRHAVQPGEKIYHLVPTEYVVDGEREINKPVGIAGRRIDATFNIILASDNYEKNLTRAIEKAGFELAHVFINPFVQGTSCLSQDEKEAGVVLLDLGAGTTGISLYYENKLRLALELPFGGNVISNDIKEGCNIIPRHAEMVKVNCGFAMIELAPDNKVAQIPEVEGWPGKEISFKSLAGIIQARVEEIMEWVNFQLESSGYMDKLGAGIVLTGKGSGLNGLDKVVSYMTGLDVRYGRPIVAMKEQLFNEQLATPASANLLGILIHGLINSRNLKYPAGMVDPIVQEEAPKTEPVKRKTRSFHDLVGKVRDGFDGLFEEPDHK
ncbi:MAG: cell division protein FtsA [Prolixibacteraceae bacterium]|jgi:cell division protein FtsA|nr:cell division protein FtsA [Prolixibacteraceae bacterium]